MAGKVSLLPDHHEDANADTTGEARVALVDRYESPSGDEVVLDGARGTFVCKRLAKKSSSAGR